MYYTPYTTVRLFSSIYLLVQQVRVLLYNLHKPGRSTMLAKLGGPIGVVAHPNTLHVVAVGCVTVAHVPPLHTVATAVPMLVVAGAHTGATP